MTVGNNTLYFTSDTVTYNGTTYYYAKNLQGDIVAILNSSGTAVVQYTYDAWGKLLSTTGSMANTLGVHNPLRYRGYVYDTETGLYYLQSRYYNPNLGRFLNADALVATGQGVLGNNMFAYCGNNPVRFVDYQGYFSVNFSAICLSNGGVIEHYGQGKAISMSIYNQSVYIDAYMTFNGAISPMELIQGIEDYWEGTYTNSTISFNVFITIHIGESSEGYTIMVNSYDDNSRGYCTWNPITWKQGRESAIHVSTNYYKSVSCGWTMAHEFGHSLGVLDYYTQSNLPGFQSNYPSIMNLPGVHANFYDMIHVINANRYNCFQEWYCIGGM